MNAYSNWTEWECIVCGKSNPIETTTCDYCKDSIYNRTSEVKPLCELVKRLNDVLDIFDKHLLEYKKNVEEVEQKYSSVKGYSPTPIIIVQLQQSENYVSMN